MAGENIKVLAGEPISVRATARFDASEGDYIMLERRPESLTSTFGTPFHSPINEINLHGGTAGFWLHDTKMGEVGDVCVFAPVAEIPNTLNSGGGPRPVKAGEVYTAGLSGINESSIISRNRLYYRNSTYTVVIIYEDTPDTSDRVKVVWGLH